MLLIVSSRPCLCHCYCAAVAVAHVAVVDAVTMAIAVTFSCLSHVGALSVCEKVSTS